MLKKIEVDGVQGYFIPKEKGEELEQFFQQSSSTLAKVIQNADHT